ncbi:hypothetical protein ACQ4LE_002005 [Meloidogyne hapla]
MKINFRCYLRMFSIALIVSLLLVLISVFYSMPYSGSGITSFFEGNFTKTLPYVSLNMPENDFLSIPLLSFTYFIMIFCGIKMIRYLKSHSGIDAKIKIYVKQLTKTLIILAIIPCLNYIAVQTIILSIKKEINITRFLFSFLMHLTPVFNPIVCILTNKPYRSFIFNRLKIHPQQNNLT